MASRLLEISKAIADAPDVDRRKVTSIRESLARGLYRVDPGRIADKLIRLEKALSGGQCRERVRGRPHAGHTGPVTR